MVFPRKQPSQEIWNNCESRKGLKYQIKRRQSPWNCSKEAPTLFFLPSTTASCAWESLKSNRQEATDFICIGDPRLNNPCSQSRSAPIGASENNNKRWAPSLSQGWRLRFRATQMLLLRNVPYQHSPNLQALYRRILRPNIAFRRRRRSAAIVKILTRQ